MADVVELNCVTRLDRPVSRVLEKALAEGLTDVIVIGYREDGSEYFDSAKPAGDNAVWHLTRAIHNLIKLAD